ncbi:hypothetical protein A2291_05055 [candidate division WOR-1 bacterium RIFOXYB2_FULL_42_35]|uniref:Outer membrane protein beta-barrel domain-containing protein n=1 Tax=candidate division WOR-1 bacterium RIFOXYC2_FULL_41_25 TaxID=1802586 RepID=A0A1F4TN26_UNCSA|nr:MAG: hypothetical protein A2247_00475 [candidate division WOR-1 bacterium RIFOXYA2_FULL_41_14]OGC24469.1 MAG: hypothetical protein A2291_05055 [candidate division WOR-1 bacterium RIFOXYB2_FULL_42_35]OGC34086.1 MAG: hypothetical protein A2462_00915 [candidate division WOR-1 bacterium RIFOXYC2_FULL_41_25]OGC43089.1 MAG: hypothetical protein A2548_03150 [candidate division WOR-1 bacterium RIFOXYD2_FULL_41_8]
MKKIFVALLIGVFAIAVAASAGTAGKIGVGIDTAGGNLGVANAQSLVVRYNFTDMISAGLGLNYNSYTSGATTTSQLGYSLRVNYALPVVGAAMPFVGLQYSSDGATAATTILSLVLGAEVEINNVVIGAGLIPYSSTSASGATTSGYSTGTMNTSGRAGFISAGFYLN